MKILVHIDQRKSIAEGAEAPNSTEVFEMPVENIPETIRRGIAPLYNPASGAIEPPAPYLHNVGLRVTATAPLDEFKVRCALSAFLHRLDQARDEVIAKQRESIQERIRRHEAILAESKLCYGGAKDDAVDGVKFSYSTYRPEVPHVGTDILNSPVYQEWLRANQSRIEDLDRIAAQKTRESREEAARLALERKAKQDEEDNQIRQALTDDNQRERWERGVLPTSELRRALAQAILHPEAKIMEDFEGVADSSNGVPPFAWKDFKVAEKWGLAPEFVLVDPDPYDEEGESGTPALRLTKTLTAGRVVSGYVLLK